MAGAQEPASSAPLGEWERSPWSRIFVRRLRVVRRMVGILLWTLVAIPIQAVCLLLPGEAKVHFARCYWAVFAWLMGIRVRVIGERARRTDGRPVLFVSNHSSWLDIPVLGGQLDACFVAKDDVGRWPVISTIAKLGRSVFVSRARGSTGRERNAMVDRLAAGDNLLLFPEGTTSDGARVLPFRSAFFAITELLHGAAFPRPPGGSQARTGLARFHPVEMCNPAAGTIRRCAGIAQGLHGTCAVRAPSIRPA